MPTLYLIDGNSYLYRAFYAIRNLSAPDGSPTNAIYGFTTMILKILREKDPDYFAIVFDTPRKGNSHGIRQITQAGEASDEYRQLTQHLHGHVALNEPDGVRG